MSETEPPNDDELPPITPQVERLRSTPRADELVVQAARGDYFDGFIGDVPLESVLEPVRYEDHHYDAEQIRTSEWMDEYHVPHTDNWEERFNVEQKAKTRALITKLMRSGHWGPFEHPQITFAISAISRACMAQLTRHRHASFDVQSQRYVDFGDKEAIIPQSLLDDEHVAREAGLVDVDGQGELARRYEDDTARLFERYQEAVEAGVPKEDARFWLPTGTPVNLTVSMSARSLLHVMNLRSKADSQWEIRALMEQIEEHFRDWMPITMAVWDEFGPVKEAP